MVSTNKGNYMAGVKGKGGRKTLEQKSTEWIVNEIIISGLSLQNKYETMKGRTTGFSVAIKRGEELVKILKCRMFDVEEQKTLDASFRKSVTWFWIEMLFFNNTK